MKVHGNAKATRSRESAKFPLWLKLAYTAFVAVLVPAYLREYGPTNFLWFSDVALLVGVAAIWRGSSLLASTQALAVVIPDLLWVLDYSTRLVTGRPITGGTDYMFDPNIPVFVRALSLFHFWLPLLLLWMVRRYGYDRRALRIQIAIGTALLITTYVLTTPEQNVNWIHRLGPFEGIWPLVVAIGGFPLLFYLPAHMILLKTMPPK